jgi:hypothetical protein
MDPREFFILSELIEKMMNDPLYTLIVVLLGISLVILLKMIQPFDFNIS